MLAMLGLWSRPDAMVVARRGNPLHAAEVDDGLYFGTLAEGLPGRVGSVEDSTAWTVRRRGDDIVSSRRIIESVEDDAPLYRVHAAGGYRGG